MTARIINDLRICTDCAPRWFTNDEYGEDYRTGACDPRNVIKETRPAAPTEYAPLLSELQSIGYNLRVMHRLPAWHAMPRLNRNN